MKRTLSTILAAALALGLLAGCGSKPGDVYGKKDAAAKPEQQEKVSLKLGLLPIVDSLPFWVAESKGYFASQNLDVELITYTSAAERDDAIASGEIDGAVADLVTTAALYGSGTKVNVASLSLGALPAESPVGILAGKGSGITEISALKGEEIAVAINSAAHYAAEQMLLANGFAPGEINFVSAPETQARYASLMSGDIKAAVLPDPQLSIAAGQGAKLLVTDAKVQHNYSQSVILFREDRMNEKLAGIKRLFITYNQAIVDIKLNPEAQIDLLIEKAQLPVLIKAVYDKEVPFSPAQAPQKEDVERVVNWLLEKGILKSAVTYDQLVNPAALPQQ